MTTIKTAFGDKSVSTIEEQIEEARDDLAYARTTYRPEVSTMGAAHDRAVARAASRLATLEAVRDGRMIPVYATVCVDTGSPRGWVAHGTFAHAPLSDVILSDALTAVGLLSEMQVPVHLEYKAREVGLENAKAYIARLEGIQAELTEVDKAREAELKAHKERVTELEQEIETVEAEQAQAERKLNAAYHEMEIRAAENLVAVQRLRATRGKPPEPNKVVVAEPLDADKVTILRGYAHVPSTQVHEVEADSEVPS